MTEEKDTENKIMKEALDKALKELIPELIEHTFAASVPGTNMPPGEKQEEIPIYEKLSPGEVFIISRNDKGILVAANDDGECDIRYYNDSEE